MTIPEFVQLIHPYCCGEDGRSKGEFMAIVIGKIIEDGSEDNCPVLNASKTFLRSIYRGDDSLPLESARIMLSHIDKEKFAGFVSERLTIDSAGTLSEKLITLGFANDGSCDDLGEVCANIFEDALEVIVNSDGQVVSGKKSLRDKTVDAITQLRAQLDQVKPTPITPPPIIGDEEMVYVKALYAAYGDRSKVSGFSSAHLMMPEYEAFKDDFSDRRIDYFSAETIRRGVQEVFDGRFSDQFDVLKQETYDGIKNTVRRSFPDGYEKMLAVMEQAVLIPVEQYLLSNTKYWIGNSIMCGVCHHLVNDGRVKWV